jgi:transcriptional regulator with XRE-family HTH domain
MEDRTTVNDSAELSQDRISRLVGRRIRSAREECGMTLAQLGGKDLTRGFLSAVETGRSSISLNALSIVADRLKLPIAYFVDTAPVLSPPSMQLTVDHVEAALAYGLYLRSKGKTEEALEYALWAAQAKLTRTR